MIKLRYAASLVVLLLTFCSGVSCAMFRPSVSSQEKAEVQRQLANAAEDPKDCFRIDMRVDTDKHLWIIPFCVHPDEKTDPMVWKCHIWAPIRSYPRPPDAQGPQDEGQDVTKDSKDGEDL